MKKRQENKTLITIIGEHQSEAIKSITLLYTHFVVFVSQMIASNKLNKNLSANSRFQLHMPISNLKLK